MQKNILKVVATLTKPSRVGYLPILSRVNVVDGTATVTDLDTWLQWPVTEDNGLYALVGGKLILTTDIQVEFPLSPVVGGDITTITNHPSAAEVKWLSRAASKDKCKPNLSAIAYNNGVWCTTDGHRLHIMGDWHEFNNKKIVPLHTVTVPLIPFISSYQESSEYTLFTLPDDVKLYQREVGQFPDVSRVLPGGGKYSQAQTIYHRELKGEVKVAKELIKAGIPDSVNMPFKAEGKTLALRFTDTKPEHSPATRRCTAIIMPLSNSDNEQPQVNAQFLLDTTELTPLAMVRDKISPVFLYSAE